MSIIRGMAKTLVVFFNVILSILGIGFIVIGSLLATAFKTYTQHEIIKVELIWGPVAGLIILGLFLVVTSICGIVAVLGSNTGLAKAYLALLCFIVIIEVTLAVLFIVYKKDINKEIDNGIKQTIATAYSKLQPDQALKNSLDTLQKNLKCCGSDGAQDYVNTSTVLGISHPPDSCCVTFKAGCSTVALPAFFQKGCKQEIEMQYSKYSTIVIGVASSFAVLELFAIAYSIYIINKETYYNATMV